MFEPDQKLSERLASDVGARRSWLVRAQNVPEVLAKLGLIGPGDRLVVCANDFEACCRRLFPSDRVCFVAEPTSCAFTAASVDGVGATQDQAVPFHHASYAHAAGACFDRLFWLVSSIGCKGMRVADLRALSEAARRVGAILLVDNTVASSFGCQPLRWGAPVVLEALDRVAAGMLPEKLVAVSVARSVVGRGRKQRIDAVAEQAYLMLAMRLGGERGSFLTGLAPESIAAVADGLTTLHQRMQRHADNARALAEYLACNPYVVRVAYPGLANHPDHETATRVLQHGFGPALDVQLPDGIAAGEFVAQCAAAHRESPAGAACTRIAARDGAEAHMLRIFAGTDDIRVDIDAIDATLRALSTP